MKTEEFNDIMDAVLRVNPEMKDDRTIMNIWSRTVVASHMRRRGYSSTEVGKMLGKDHATVLHYEKQYADLMKYDKVFQEFNKQVYDSYMPVKRKEDQQKENELLKDIDTESLIKELNRRTNMKDYYFRVDGYSTMIHADSLEEAERLMKETYPESSVELMRVIPIETKKKRKDETD